MAANPALRFIDLGRLPYAAGYEAQCAHLEEVLASRDSPSPETGRVLLLEHDPPVITVSRRPDARRHLIATPRRLAEEGIEVAETDRGGDITYHGPGQLVVYPILDLNALKLRLHEYMRLLEAAVIDTCRAFGVRADRDACATGVWVSSAGTDRAPANARPACAPADAAGAKICAMGVRVRRWITMHGLALNVTTNLDHFRLIVPCGLDGRAVTSLANELGHDCPTMERVKRELSESLSAHIARHAQPTPAPQRA